MSDLHAPKKALTLGDARARVRSFLGWAFALSIVLHAVTLPFFGLKAQARERPESERFSVTDVLHVKAPTPPPPTPTPAPPTPPPQSTPTPSRRTNLAPPAHHTIHVVTLQHDARSHPGHASVAITNVGTDAGISGVPATGSPGPQTTGLATEAPASAPPAATPKPSCPNPNVAAGIKGQAAEPAFPDAARLQGASGTTDVEVMLDATGTAVAVSVHTSSGFAVLDRAALDAARATAYTPEVVDCVKTAGQYIFRADFESQ
jgi:periplasmic protein TonB